MSDLPRSEYPRPQFVRDNWLCLNGTWQFEIDHGDSGLERGLRDRELAQQITVPFCPESELSGIHHVDFMNAVWYRREIRVPDAWQGQRILLHFQAVDYDATVWANGEEVGRHRGGWCGFTCDITEHMDNDKATIVVRARDDHRQAKPQGKQSPEYTNHGCVYTRTTGIWQTVWLEPVPKRAHLLRPRITPDVGASRFVVETPTRHDDAGMTVRATLCDDAGDIASETIPAGFGATAILTIPDERIRYWSIDDPYCYDLTIELLDEQGCIIDMARSYAGFRGITIDGLAVKLNGKSVFQRLVLDQGYYPDGIMTAPNEQALIDDIAISMEAGFNGARLHEKVFEERFLYHCDRMGYLVWGEYGDWGRRNFNDPSITTQWCEVVERDYNHPAIIGWCPLNETPGRLSDTITAHDDVMHGTYQATKLADRTRPVLDVSGWSHRVRQADIYDVHDYCQDPAQLAERYANTINGQPRDVSTDQHQNILYAGQPFFVSEFGGIWWNPDAEEGEDSWGYGQRPKTEQEVYDRFAGLCAALLENPAMFGYCYTQLTDVFQEQNGIVRFDRSRKLDLAKLREAQQRPAAIEQ